MLINVSMVVAPWRRFVQVARWNGQAPHTTTGEARRERRPHPLVELQGRDHGQRDHRDGENGGDQQPLPSLLHRFGVVVIAGPWGRVVRSVAARRREVGLVAEAGDGVTQLRRG